MALTAPAIKKFVFWTRFPKITRRNTSSSNIGANRAMAKMAIGTASAICIREAVFSDSCSIPSDRSMSEAMAWPKSTMKKPAMPQRMEAGMELRFPFKLFMNVLSLRTMMAMRIVAIPMLVNTHQPLASSLASFVLIPSWPLKKLNKSGANRAPDNCIAT